VGGRRGAHRPARERREPCHCFCYGAARPASRGRLSPPVTSSARAPPPPARAPGGSFPAGKFPGRHQGQRQSPMWGISAAPHPFAGCPSAPGQQQGHQGRPQFNTFSEKCPSFPSSCTGCDAWPWGDGGPVVRRDPPLPAPCSSAHFSL